MFVYPDHHVIHRETLLGQLQVYVRQTRDDFVSRSGGTGSKGPPKGKNLPEMVNCVIWVRQLEAKVRDSVSHKI